MDTVTIKHLADAAASLQAAYKATPLGFVADECENAISRIKSAMRMAMNPGDDEDGSEGGEGSATADHP